MHDPVKVSASHLFDFDFETELKLISRRGVEDNRLCPLWSVFCRRADLHESSQALCRNRSRPLSLSGGNRWKLVDAKDSLPVTDVTGSACLFEGE